MKLIDADVLIEQMDAEPEGGYYSPHDVISLLMTQPVVEERKTGMWRRAQYGYTCNQCGKTHLLRTAYCPTCGAEMDC